MSPTVSRVHVASNLDPDLGTALRQGLRDAGYGDQIAVEELKFHGPVRGVVLHEETLQKIPDIQYLVADPDILHQIFDDPRSNLVWAQTSNAGVDMFFRGLEKTEKKPNFLMTRHFSGFGNQMAEYVLGRIIFRERQFGYVHEKQMEKHYRYLDPDLIRFRTLNQLAIGILGFGEIGQKVAQCCKFMGMTVWAAVRDERYSDQKDGGFQHAHHVRPMSRLPEMMESCDYLVNILPSSPGTRNLLSGDVLKPCQNKKSVLINIGRGDVIDDESLINAIRSGWLGGAILDVFNKEPLPPTSELWTLPGVTITPHFAATTVSGKTRPADSFIYNLKLYLEGKPMRCAVDFNKGY